MEEIGPSPGLPALSALLQAASVVEPSLLDGSAAPDTGLGLLADAAALPMRSPAPSSLTNLFLLDAGLPQLDASSGIQMDVAMDSWYEALDDVDAGPLPELLGVAWGSSETAVPESVTSSGAPMSPASFVASPSAPSPFATEALPAALLAVEPPPSAMPAVALLPAVVSPSRDPVADQEKVNADPYDADTLLAAADIIRERPNLPDPPERHPSARWWNHFNPDASVNPTRAYPLEKQIDRWGTPPHVAYLVEWEVIPCQLSWDRVSSTGLF
ncbi:hypothetical protein DVH05_023900 [Phytophthora capsici]|nr:hypothetical protein DVH05_023900 [Phytophthora capsici]